MTAVVGVPVTPDTTAVIVFPVATAFAPVALVVAAVELTATALRPVTDVPLIWMSAVNVPPVHTQVTDSIVALDH